MREIDTETSVVWPAWCYSGETVNEDLPQTAISPSSLQQQSSNQSQSQLNKNRGKRKSTTIQPIRTASNNNDSNSLNNNNNNINNNSHQTTLQSLDKMLSERIYERKKYLNSPNNSNSFYEKLRNGDSDNQSNINLINSINSKSVSDLSAMNNISLNNSNQNNSSSSSNNNININNNNNGNNSSSNNNNSTASIKSERFSPNNNDVQSTASRSRSVTPSSFSGTPPQIAHSNEMYAANVPASSLLPSPNSNSSRPEFQARNYSDFMRSLAAKYNNNNEHSNIKNPFLEPKMRTNQPKPFVDNPLTKKTSPISSAQVPNSSSIMSSLFPGLPFQTAVFPPLIDMSSTQALVALARAAKETELQNILKGDSIKKSANNSRNSSPPLQNQFQSPFPPNYIPGIIPNSISNFSSQSSSSSSSLKSPSRPAESSTFPLDLSSAPSMNKRIKLSPNPASSPVPTSTNSQPNEIVDEKNFSKCHAQSDEINSWSVENVCDFVGSIDICAEYVQNFRDQSIDGTGLPLLTEEHLTNSLGMKLGPALKLKSLLAKKIGGPCPCASCAVASPKVKGEISTTPTRPLSNGSGS